MLRLTYIPVDDEHEPAVVEYKTDEITSTPTGIQFEDGDSGMTRMIHYKKITKVEFTLDVPDAFVNRANNIMRMKKANSKSNANVTVR